jgi:hypothetical protein
VLEIQQYAREPISLDQTTGGSCDRAPELHHLGCAGHRRDVEASRARRSRIGDATGRGDERADGSDDEASEQEIGEDHEDEREGHGVERDQSEQGSRTRSLVTDAERDLHRRGATRDVDREDRSDAGSARVQHTLLASGAFGQRPQGLERERLTDLDGGARGRRNDPDGDDAVAALALGIVDRDTRDVAEGLVVTTARHVVGESTCDRTTEGTSDVLAGRAQGVAGEARDREVERHEREHRERAEGEHELQAQPRTPRRLEGLSRRHREKRCAELHIRPDPGMIRA